MQFSRLMRMYPAGTFRISFIADFASFFAKSFLRSILSYQLVYRELQESVTSRVILYVQTPLIPPSLSTATQVD